ncbi:MAG: hypothetical protein ACYCTL_11795 [Acidimicrobiales bacterium]
MSTSRPPEDAEQWSDDQWLEWLRATDDPSCSTGDPSCSTGDPSCSTGDPSWAPGDGEDTHPDSAMGRATSPRAGGMLGSAMLGLAQALYGDYDDEIAIVQEAPGGPADEETHQIHLDEEHPERSVVIVRRPGPCTVRHDRTEP